MHIAMKFVNKHNHIAPIRVVAAAETVGKKKGRKRK
jgi:hypothetical protein